MGSRNKQLKLYENNWATLEIMKTIIKNKRSYRSKIGRPGSNKHDDNRELPDQTQSSRSRQAAHGASGSDDEASGGPGEEGYSNSDEGNREVSDAEEDGSGISSAGMKRKASRSGGSGGKGKQRKV